MGAGRVASAPVFAGLGGTAPITAVDPRGNVRCHAPERGVRRSQRNFSNQPTVRM
jgi:hypothetical protein